MYKSTFKDTQVGDVVTTGDFFSQEDPVEVFTGYLKRSAGDDGEAVRECLLAAVDNVENYLWYDVHLKNVTQYCVPVDNKIKIERHRLRAADDLVVKYYNSAGALTTLTTVTDYRYEEGYIPYVKLLTTPTWQDRQDAFVITYVTGFANYDAVPSDILKLIHKLGAYHFECRLNEKQADMSWVERYCISIRNFRF